MESGPVQMVPVCPKLDPPPFGLGFLNLGSPKAGRPTKQRSRVPFVRQPPLPRQVACPNGSSKPAPRCAPCPWPTNGSASCTSGRRAGRCVLAAAFFGFSRHARKAPEPKGSREAGEGIRLRHVFRDKAEGSEDREREREREDLGLALYPTKRNQPFSHCWIFPLGMTSTDHTGYLGGSHIRGPQVYSFGILSGMPTGSTISRNQTRFLPRKGGVAKKRGI